MNRQQMILSAFACHPEMSSEPGVGWAFLSAAAGVARARGIRLVAIMNGRSAVASKARLHDMGCSAGVEILGLDVPEWLHWLQNPRYTRMEYIVWNCIARRAMSRLADQAPVSLAMHVTFATEVLPTPVAALSDSTLRVWGPIGSSGSWRAFVAAPREPRWWSDAVKQMARDALAPLLARHYARHVDLILAMNQRVSNRLRGTGRSVRVFPNVIIPRELELSVLSRDAGDRSSQVPPYTYGLNLLVAGHLIPRKRVGLALKALTDSKLKDARLVVAGAPLPGVEEYLPRLARKLGVRDRVDFLGSIRRSDLLQKMATADVLVHLSAREGAPGVVGEATSVGLPVVCLADSGAAAIVSHAGASGVAITETQLSAASIADAIVLAATLPRIAFGGWTEARFAALVGEMLDEAERRTHRSHSDPA